MRTTIKRGESAREAGPRRQYVEKGRDCVVEELRGATCVGSENDL